MLKHLIWVKAEVNSGEISYYANNLMFSRFGPDKNNGSVLNNGFTLQEDQSLIENNVLRK